MYRDPLTGSISVFLANISVMRHAWLLKEATLASMTRAILGLGDSMSKRFVMVLMTIVSSRCSYWSS